MQLNLSLGWIGILVGLVAGAAIGFFFHRDDWLGGYASFPRRMLRLGHISLVGIGLLNIAYALSIQSLGIAPSRLAANLFIVGMITMPTVCGLAAWRKSFRQLFFIPVLSLVVATAVFIAQGVLP